MTIIGVGGSSRAPLRGVYTVLEDSESKLQTERRKLSLVVDKVLESPHAVFSFFDQLSGEALADGHIIPAVSGNAIAICSPFALEQVLSLSSPVLDIILAQVTVSVPPFETKIHKGAGIDALSWSCLDNLEDLDWITNGSNSWFGDLEKAKGYAEKNLRTFIEESIPNTENAFNRKVGNEAGHKPRGGAERNVG